MDPGLSSSTLVSISIIVVVDCRAVPPIYCYQFSKVIVVDRLRFTVTVYKMIEVVVGQLGSAFLSFVV